MSLSRGDFKVVAAGFLWFFEGDNDDDTVLPGDGLSWYGLTDSSLRDFLLSIATNVAVVGGLLNLTVSNIIFALGGVVVFIPISVSLWALLSFRLRASVGCPFAIMEPSKLAAAAGGTESFFVLVLLLLTATPL